MNNESSLSHKLRKQRSENGTKIRKSVTITDEFTSLIIAMITLAILLTLFVSLFQLGKFTWIFIILVWFGCFTYPFRLKNVHIKQLIRFHAYERELGRELAFVSKVTCLEGFRSGKATISVREFGIVVVVGLDNVLCSSYYGIKSINVENHTITMVITRVIDDGLIEAVPVIFNTPQINKFKIAIRKLNMDGLS